MLSSTSPRTTGSSRAATQRGRSPFANSNNSHARIHLRRFSRRGLNGRSQIGNVRFSDFESVVPTALSFTSAMIAVVEREDVEAFRSKVLDIRQSIPAISVQLVAVHDRPSARFRQTVQKRATQNGPVTSLEANFLPPLPAVPANASAARVAVDRTRRQHQRAIREQPRARRG